MSTKYLFKTKKSCIAIKDDRLYIISTKYKDYSARAVTVIPGFQIELGRKMSDITEALKETRLPIIIKEVVMSSRSSIYQIVRMHTGKVDDKIIATLACENDIITNISFNRELLTDMNYRRYSVLSVFHQLSIPYELSQSQFKVRRDQVYSILSSVISLTNAIQINEGKNSLEVITNEDEQKLKFLFVLNKKTNRYELTSIALQQGD